ncbi:MAG: hypothetical protein KC729_03465 [Candidatus Eisenbacteria bacterium]|uniref:Cytochrome c7-like domain-containing protein n=1 Tax=Eiseniibacteriota bacterium TaxID=2212470 RepID=A0A956RNH8_UNCEI|nr:hypothetical protein [Candidatus Eisenbacteria bacterium]
MNQRWMILTVGAALTSVLSAGLLFGRTKDLRSSDEIHGIHAEQELDCATCHPGVAESMHGTDELRPTMDACADCHDIEDATNCKTCHQSAEPGGYPERAARVQLFPHATHLESGLVCSDCHGDDWSPVMPTMETCRECHATASGLTDCGNCHAQGEALIPETHTPGWLAFHPVEAGWNDDACSVCHTQNDCQQCHAGDNVRPRSHPIDFAFNHSVEAKASETECATCHLEADFCSSCHVAEHVLPQNHSRADWLSGRTGGRHAEEARFDLESCVACHDQGADEPVCAECHGR